MIINKKVATGKEISREYETEHQLYYEHTQTLKEFMMVSDNLWINYDWLISYLKDNCICSEGNEGFCLMCDIIEYIKGIIPQCDLSQNNNNEVEEE